MRVFSPSFVLCIALFASVVNANEPTSPSSSSLSPSPSSTPSALPNVASINLCADQLVLLLAEPEQILTLSNLSHDSGGSYFYEQAREFPVSKGGGESMLMLQPDLILAGQYTTKHSVKLLTELGLRVEIVPIVNTLEQLYENILRVAELVGHSDKGRDIVADLRERVALQESNLANLKQPNPTAAFYDPNGYTAGHKTLRGLSLQLAGWSNVAADWGIDSYGSMPLESMVTLSPEAIIDSPYSEGTYSRGQQLLEHPALRARGLDPMVINIPSRQTICAGPWTVDMIELLAAKREEVLFTRP